MSCREVKHTGTADVGEYGRADDDGPVRASGKVLGIVLCLSTGLLSAGCGDDSSSAPSAPVPPEPVPSEPPAPPPDDHGDQEGTATAIGVPSTTRGELGHFDDIDAFRFRLDSSGGTLTVETTGQTNVIGLVKGPNDLRLEDDDSGPGSNYRIIVNNARSGVYYAGVRGVTPRTEGRYELHVRYDHAPSDDHGDDRASATRVGVPSDTAGRLTAGDTDYFIFFVNRPGTLEVYTTSSIDTAGQLEDSGGSRLTSNDDSGSNSNFRIERNVSRGTHYIRVRGFGSSTVGDYRLHLRLGGVASPPDLTIRDFRINLFGGDTPARSVEPGARLSLAASVHNAGDATAPPTRVTYHSGPRTFITRDHLRVGEDNTASLDPGETQHLAQTVTAPSNPGIYYYGACAEPVSGERVTHNNCSDGVRLEVGSAPQSDDHGDSRSDATRINVPSETDGTLTPGDTDYFRISVNSPGTLEVYATGSIDTVGQIEDSGGSRLASDDDTGPGRNFRIERDVSSGTYYIRVRGFGSSTAGNYTLHVRFSGRDNRSRPTGLRAEVSRPPNFTVRGHQCGRRPDGTDGPGIYVEWNSYPGADGFEAQLRRNRSGSREWQFLLDSDGSEFIPANELWMCVTIWNNSADRVDIRLRAVFDDGSESEWATIYNIDFPENRSRATSAQPAEGSEEIRIDPDRRPHRRQ